MQEKLMRASTLSTLAFCCNAIFASCQALPTSPSQSVLVSANNGKSKASVSEVQVKESSERAGEVAAQARKLLEEGQFDKGTAMLLRSMKQEDGVSWNSMMYSAGNIREDLCFEKLIEAKQFSSLEQLLKQSMSLHQLEPYDFNHDCYIEKCLLAEMFLRARNYPQAETWIKASIATLNDDQSICNNGARSFAVIHTENIVPLATLCIKQRKYALAETALRDISTVLAKRVGPRHKAWVKIWLTESDLASHVGNLDTEERLARKAFELETWTYGPTQNMCGSREALAKILKDRGKSKESAEIFRRPEPLAEAPERWSELYDGSFGLHTPAPEFYAARAEEPLIVLLQNYSAVHGKGSYQVKKGYEDLARYYFQQHRFDDCRRTVLEELAIIDEQYGTCLLPKFSCHLRLTELCQQANDKDGANKYVDLLESTPMDKYWPVNKSIRVANVLWYVDRHDRANEIATEVETDLKQRAQVRRREISIDPTDCIEFMERANRKEDAESLRTTFAGR